MVLASSGAIAEMMEPSLSLGGFMNHSTHFADQDSHENRGNVSHRLNTEIFFRIAGELENGLKIGGRLELEGTTLGDQIDESYLDIGAAWGKIRLGMANSGRHSDTFKLYAPNAAYGVSSGVWHFWFDHPGTTGDFRFEKPLGSVNTDIADDDPIVSYYSPRFNGFQFTVSHRPAVESTGGKWLRVANEDTHYSNAMDGSINYQGEMGGVGVTAMVGAAGATGPNTEIEGSCGNADYEALNAGIKLSAHGFSVGGQLADVEDQRNCGSGTAYHVGASYGQGPWAVSITALDGEVEHTPADGDATQSVWSLGASYVIGPGLKALASYQDIEVEGDGGESNAGQAFMVGLNLGF